MNPIAEALTGWTQNEALGKPMANISILLVKISMNK